MVKAVYHKSWPKGYIQVFLESVEKARGKAVGSGEAGEALASQVFNPYSYISVLTVEWTLVT